MVTNVIPSHILYLFDYGKRDGQPRTLRITIPENLQYDGLFDGVFDKYLHRQSLMRVQTTDLGTMIQLQYEIVTKDGVYCPLRCMHAIVYNGKRRLDGSRSKGR